MENWQAIFFFFLPAAPGGGAGTVAMATSKSECEKLSFHDVPRDK